MLNYIKEQIRARQPIAEPFVTESVQPENIDDDVLLEYAHLFQELDDLSVEGLEVDSVRKLGVDIPFDDTEVETIEFNINSGTVSDVPGDTTAVTESYETMKTYDVFFQEAMTMVPRLSRESNSEYDKRVGKLADKLYTEYCEDAKRIGAFGFSTIPVTDESVPSKILVDFGPIEKDSNKSFVSKIKTFFGINENQRIFKKQLDAVRLVQEGAFTNIGEPLMAYMESHYNVPVGDGVWDICTPKNLYVPKGNGDSFCVVLEYTNEITGKNEFFGWTAPVNESKKELIDVCSKINMESFVNETTYVNKDAIIQESTRTYIEEKKKKYVPRSRFYQEAIDFGGNEGGDAGTDLPPAENTNADNGNGGGDTNTTPPAEGNNSPTDQNVDSSSGSDAAPADASSSEGTDENKETAAVNDVSSQIAEKVANDTQQQAEQQASDDMGTEVTFSGDTGDTTSTDTSGNIDTSLDSGDTGDTGNTDDVGDVGDVGTSDVDNTTDDFATSDENINDTEGIDDMSDEDDMPDLDNMTIDQIIDQGTEKLKGMTMSEIKNFISTASPTEIQEAFVLTDKNINKELDVRLREVLGILNDNQMDISKLIRKFKFNSHRLNRVLSKAAKKTKVYSTNEIESINKLNSALNELSTVMRSKNVSAQTIKRNIANFTKQSKTVAAFVEEKMNGNKQETVQEGFFLSANNVKKRLGRKIIPVLTDMKDLVASSDKERLTKSKLVRMYKGNKRTFTTHAGGEYGGALGGTSSSEEYDTITPASANLSNLASIIGKILRKQKVQSAFTGSQLEMISDVNEYVDDFIDLLESILYDNSEASSLLSQVSELSKKLVITLTHLLSACQGTDDVVTDTTPSEQTPSESEEENNDTSTSDDTTDDMPSLDDTDDDESSKDEEEPEITDDVESVESVEDDDDDDDEEDDD